MQRVMARLAISAAIVVAAALGTPGHALAAGAVDRQAWAETSLVATFVPQANTLYVAQNLGVEEARAFLHVDPAAIPAASVDGVSLTVAEASDTNVVQAGGLLACPLTTPLVSSGQVTGEAAPNVDCTSAKPATRAGNGTWTVPVAGLLDGWRAGTTFGVALVPDPATPATFRIAFDPAKTTFTAPAVAAPDAGVANNTADVAGAAGATSDLASAPLAGALTGGVASLDPLAANAAPADLHAAPTLPITDVQRAAATAGRPTGNAASPPAAAVLPIVALAALGLGLTTRRRTPSPNSPRLGAYMHLTVASSWGGWGIAAAAMLLPTLLGEATVYKLGLVLILFVGAIGLHLLVNWAGELSLAHAAMVGLPAFAVAKLSADHHISPLVLLPVGLIVGLGVGALVGLPAMRARGLQVALVTLAAGVAVDRFFFTKEWLVGGQSGAEVSVPRLGPFTFATARSLYPLLAAIVVLSVIAAAVVYRSKVGRAFLWVKANPDAAAAFGVPVAAYRIAAYALAGAFAGLSGGLTAAWVGRLTPQSFPLTKSFTYLIIVALAGRGFVGGVAAAAAFIEGGRLFLPNADAVLTYGAPVGLIFTLTHHRTGLNGFGRQIAGRVRSVIPARERTMNMEDDVRTRPRPRALTLIGAVVFAVGLAAIALAWYHAGNTSQVWVQNQELISGGLGGLALVVAGVGLLVYDGVAAARALDAARWERLLHALENRDRPAPVSRRRQRDAA